ncbi:hypothetical protein CSC14_0514 [Proteus mirabilis]|nr:hypothetical protein CSC14_0514 [Proteus mirabilis]
MGSSTLVITHFLNLAAVYLKIENIHIFTADLELILIQLLK